MVRLLDKFATNKPVDNTSPFRFELVDEWGL